MTKTKMPAAETSDDSFDERKSYELAFHVLPTVAEGEVAGIYETIKALITKEGGEITIDETPERVDLAYPVVKSMESKNRKFTSAYFGWIRFLLDVDKISVIDDEMASMEEILRHLIIKLTSHDEAQPFRYHENKKSVKMVQVIGENTETLEEVQTEKEENVAVSEKELDKSLDKLTEEK